MSSILGLPIRSIIYTCVHLHRQVTWMMKMRQAIVAMPTALLCNQ